MECNDDLCDRYILRDSRNEMSVFSVTTTKLNIFL